MHQLNSRKIGWSDVNIFDNFFNNKWFFFIIILELAAQWLIVQVGGDAFRTGALTMTMHLVCWGFGFGCLLVSFISKKIPIAHASKFAFNLNESNE
jgi:hypothetical protein